MREALAVRLDLKESRVAVSFVTHLNPAKTAAVAKKHSILMLGKRPLQKVPSHFVCCDIRRLPCGYGLLEMGPRDTREKSRGSRLSRGLS